MNGRKHATLGALGEHLAELAAGLADVAADLEELGRHEARDFEREAARELEDLIAIIERPERG